MLSFFPTPYPDELWYSVIARYHTHSGALSWQATMKALFGNAVTRMWAAFFQTTVFTKSWNSCRPVFCLLKKSPCNTPCSRS